MRIYPVILPGGSGTHLRPFSWELFFIRLPRTGFRYLAEKMIHEDLVSAERDEIVKHHGYGSPTITTSSS